MARLQDYNVLSIMGTGSFGTCFKVRNKLTAKLFVWKSIDYSDMDEERKLQLISEINLLKKLSHPNIVQYFNHIINKDTKTLYIIMECCEGGDLAQLIRRCIDEQCHFEEVFIWRALYQLSRALHGCHSHNPRLTILHRDIKPANVFLDLDGNVKLGDFGLARILRDTDKFAETLVGTPYYMSPEVIKGTKYNGKSDIWSLGCLVYELCALRPPFNGKRIDQLSKNIANGHFNRIPDRYSSDLQTIITFLLNVDHGYRPTIEVILHHPTVVANIDSSHCGFPTLIANSNVNGLFLPSPDMSSTQINSISFDRNTTNDLRRELFQSPQRQRQTNKNYSISEPEYVHSEEKPITKRSCSDDMTKQFKDPHEITQEIFNAALRQRLAAIKHQETILQNIENDLKRKEVELADRERRLDELEKKTHEAGIKEIKQRNRRRHGDGKPSKPLRRSRTHSRPRMAYDIDTMSIEPNDTILPITTAKIPIEKLPNIPRRHVSFKSPLKLQTLERKCAENLENLPPPLPNRKYNTMKCTKPDKCPDDDITTVPLSGSTDSTKFQFKSTTISKMVESKRKSFFNLFNINIPAKKAQDKKSNSNDKIPMPTENIQRSSTANLPTHWTAEHKRTAFEMLAVMNATKVPNSRKLRTVSQEHECDQSIVDEIVINNKIVRHDRKRQSMCVLRSSRENLLI